MNLNHSPGELVPDPASFSAGAWDLLQFEYLGCILHDFLGAGMDERP
ncbi:MAG: hypothetical protein HZB91_12850 [Elusimicrobia bacterium]|nr:hypothetical protein [Elusimicrobiota bacterium]